MNVRVDLQEHIRDGMEVVFKAPCDASEVTGLNVYYPVDGVLESQSFTFADANANDLGHLDALFAKDAVVKVILDLDTNMAFVQNADTNAYLESKFDDMIDKLCPSFTESGSVVTCEPVEGYPLGVVTQIVPIQSGSGDPSPENIRPITGHTAVALTQLGKNLLPLPAKTVTANGGTVSCDENGLVTVSGTPTGYVQLKSNSFILPSGELTLTARGDATNVVGVLQILDVNDNVLRTIYINPYENNTRTFNASASAGYDHCTFTVARDSNNVEMKGSVYYHIGSTAPAEFSMDLGETVYGGSLDWKTGVLTVDKALLTLTGEENWTYSVTSVPHDRATLTGIINCAAADGISSHYTLRSTFSSTYPRPFMRINASYSSLYYEGNQGDFADADAFKAFLAEQYAAGTPVQICYQLATPIIVQLTPTEVLALAGTNYLYSDTGNTTVTGKADPAAVIEKLTNAIIALGGNV